MAGAVIHPGYPRSWAGEVDDDGYVNFPVYFLVQVGAGEGPAAALSAVGLPVIGSAYAVMNDAYPWAWCRPRARAQLHEEREGEGDIWKVEVNYSSRPLTRCGDNNVTNPLLEPYELAISFANYSEEATHDRFGDPIVNSAWEQIRGPQAEFDASRATVRISFNTASLNLALVSSMNDTVNSHVLWGMAPRTIKFKLSSVERKFYGSCLKYYRVGYEFEARREGWDRDILDEGTKALNGKWAETTLSSGENVRKWVVQAIGQGADNADILPDQQNPSHFIRLTDEAGNPVKMILNGAGVPFDPYLDPVTTCSQCTDGAARQWILSGFAGSDYSVYEGLTLSHDGGCGWSVAASGGATWELAFDGAGWSLTNGLGQEWLLQFGTEFDCTGTNTFTRLGVDLDWPETLTLRDVDSSPGTIHIERYPESNFFLLGIPAILG
jgi:hypothetical protein